MKRKTFVGVLPDFGGDCRRQTTAKVARLNRISEALGPVGGPGLMDNIVAVLRSECPDGTVVTYLDHLEGKR